MGGVRRRRPSSRLLPPRIDALAVASLAPAHSLAGAAGAPVAQLVTVVGVATQPSTMSTALSAGALGRAQSVPTIRPVDKVGEGETATGAARRQAEESTGRVASRPTFAFSCAWCVSLSVGQSSVHRICSNQVIVDLSTAAKELLENALDAGATTVTISLQQYGTRAIEVQDNGRGISPGDLAGLALKHWTSKLVDFSDLASVRSFGFRGEALSSLCAMADVQVCTRCAGHDTATEVTYDHDGRMAEQRTKPRTVSQQRVDKRGDRIRVKRTAWARQD